MESCNKARWVCLFLKKLSERILENYRERERERERHGGGILQIPQRQRELKELNFFSLFFKYRLVSEKVSDIYKFLCVGQDTCQQIRLCLHFRFAPFLFGSFFFFLRNFSLGVCWE